MADRRLFNQVVLMSDEFLFELSEQAKNLYLAVGLSTDDYGFVKNYKRLIDETKVSTENVQELINHKFIYLIDKDTLLDLKFQINNNLAPSKTNEPRYPQGLKHVFMDIDCQYCWSSTKIRDVFGYTKGGSGKLSRKDLFIDFEDEENQHIKAVDTTQQKASDFLGATPSAEDKATVQPQPEEVAPAPTKLANKREAELRRLDDGEQEQDNDFETKMKEAHEKGQGVDKQKVNPYVVTEEGQQQAEELSKQYATAGAQTRSLDGVGLTAEQQKEFRDNPVEEDIPLPF